MSSGTVDPLRGFRFLVSVSRRVGNVLVPDSMSSVPIDLGFQKVSGLQADIGVMEWKEISNPVSPLKFPSTFKFGDLKLDRGVSTNRRGLWKWYEDVLQTMQLGTATVECRATVTIHVIPKGFIPYSTSGSGGGSGMMTWQVYHAFPKQIRFGDFDAEGSNVLIESLTLANEGFKLLDN